MLSNAIVTFDGNGRTIRGNALYRVLKCVRMVCLAFILSPCSIASEIVECFFCLAISSWSSSSVASWIRTVEFAPMFTKRSHGVVSPLKVNLNIESSCGRRTDNEMPHEYAMCWTKHSCKSFSSRAETTSCLWRCPLNWKLEWRNDEYWTRANEESEWIILPEKYWRRVCTHHRGLPPHHWTVAIVQPIWAAPSIEQAPNLLVSFSSDSSAEKTNLFQVRNCSWNGKNPICRSADRIPHPYNDLRVNVRWKLHL